MIIERTTFKARYGKGDALIDVIRDFVPAFGDRMGAPVRVATDRTGEMFIVTWDIEYDDLAAWAASMEKERDAIFATPEFGAWFARMEPLIESASRELFETVDI